MAIRITTDGYKHVLDFDLGSAENAEVRRALMRRLTRRVFHCDRRLLAVLDGSDALRSTVKEFFAHAVIQRCLAHKERNIRTKLSKRHWGELARLFKRIRQVQGQKAAQEVRAELIGFLTPLNAEALKSLHEAGDDLIALHLLEAPSTWWPSSKLNFFGCWPSTKTVKGGVAAPNKRFAVAACLLGGHGR